MPLSIDATKVRNELIQAAKYRKHVEYIMLSYLIGLEKENKDAVDKLLTEVSTAEHKEGKPILWPLVIEDETSLPSNNYYILIKKLKLENGIKDKESIYNDELEKAFSYWSRRKKTGKSGSRR